MTVTIGIVANVYNEANALPGWLETHLPFADDIRIMHAGPGGEYSTDGTIEILEKWKIPVEFCAIDDGFGVVRTKALRMSPCDWTMLLDADERFYHVHRVLQCTGESTPHSEVDAILQTYDFHDLKTMIPNWENVAKLGVNLRVHEKETYNQGEHLRQMITNNQGIDAICTIRRHWHDFTFRHPTQNWLENPDWQLRIVRNHSSIYYDYNQRMHERLCGQVRTINADMMYGPYFDHFHFSMKKLEQEQRAHDVAIYNKIHAGELPPTLEQFKNS